MTQPAKVQEPSMEEILASIRRIIADDEVVVPAAGSAAATQGAAGASVRAVQPSKPVASRGEDEIAALMADFDAPANPPASEDDVLELTDDMALSDMALSTPLDAAAPEVTDLDFDKVEPANDREFSEIAMTSEHRHPVAERPSGADRGRDDPAAEMLSRSTVSAVESAFNSLAHTVLSNNARTLEDLVREMLRPMLKSWLDDNLPGLVERIVKAEIERVSRGR